MKIGFENDCNYIKTINATCSLRKNLGNEQNKCKIFVN